ncbi:MAG: saccharopine dehydrogenase NADP-binding domain-containing protein [Dokdonella sp.]|uniref:saccharopine dehydrogenase NADP-binding domain-containing protein n=1 Tax=Dokdonella sp. TaxID=2291710 RepID=UPI003266DC55
MTDIAVVGAYGHTGRFVVAELVRRGFAPILIGRDVDKLSTMGARWPSLRRRVVTMVESASLDAALDGAKAVINCAGPFLDTATPVIEAALRARIHYLDLSAEQRATQVAFNQHAEAASDADVIVIPSMAFFGGLADLLATAAAGDWIAIDTIEVAVALDSWHPTVGTRLTGQRNHYPRLIVEKSELAVLTDSTVPAHWYFEPPFGSQSMVALPLSEVITISRHLQTKSLHSYMNLAALQDIRNPSTPPPVASDVSGRSSQRFAMSVHVRRGGELRRADASGQDIYAVSAPLVVEALERILAGAIRGRGVLPAGAAFDAHAFLAALAPHVTVQVC